MRTAAVPRAPRPVTPVSILAGRLTRLCERARELGGSAAELEEELQAARVLASGLDPYVACCTSPESPALAAVAARTRARDWEARAGATVAVEQEMLSGHVEGVALRFLVAMCRARRVLEVGMFTGYSTLALAEALPADGRLIACELDPDVAAFAQEGFDATPEGAKIDVRVGPARATLEELTAAGEEPFDLVFVDADKGGYLDYVDAVLEGGLLAEGGTICVDNTLLQGEPYLPAQPSAAGAAIAIFNATIAGDPRLEQVLLPLRDGLTLIRRVP
jgi:caffeoyl-CoA O-methyltransferase